MDNNSQYKCDHCDFKTNDKANMDLHKSTHSKEGFECEICKKKFAYKQNLNRHMKTHDLKKLKCDICFKTFTRTDVLSRHKLTHTGKDEVTPAEKLKNILTGKRPNTSTNTSQEPPQKKSKHSAASKQREIECELKDPEVIPIDLEVRDEHRSLYENNWRQIRSKICEGKKLFQYNIRLESTSSETLQSIFESVHKRMKYQYKINFAFGFILYNNVTGERRYYHASNNTRVLDSPILIQNRGDLPRLTDYLGDQLDILEYARSQRPNSQWTVDGVTNILLYIYPIRQTPIGASVQIPDYIKRNKAIISLEKDNHHSIYTTSLYDDNLCLFRCLALFNGADVKALSNPTNELFRIYCETKRIDNSISNFKGVSLFDLHEVEDIFSININVYSLNEEQNGELVRRSVSNHERTMYLNLYENHFSYITDFKLYANAFKCRTCDTIFTMSKRCTRHEKTCNGGVKHIFPGGVFRPGQSIFAQLHDHGVEIPEDIPMFYPHRATFDIECILRPDTEMTNTDKLTWVSEHEMASVSVKSNIPGFENAVCFVSDGDTKELVKRFIEYLEKCSHASYDILCSKYSALLSNIDEILEKQEAELKSFAEEKGFSKSCREAPMKTLKERFQSYLKQLPVIGFNSGRYDLNAMKKVFFPALEQLDHIGITVKRQNNFMCVATKNFKFLDICNYLAAGTSYDSFLKAFKIEQTKGFFPYEWLSSIEKLNETSLPPRSAFFSSLKGKTISEEEYRLCQNVWQHEHMSNMKDFLVWYNNLDVAPFMEAIDKMCRYFETCSLDIFKDGISMPGLAMRDLFRDIGTFFSLTKESDKDIFYLLKDQIVGGPSIIFHRHQEAGKTKIRHGKTCESVVGFDANALYLWCLMQPMPTGYYITRDRENEFRAKHSHPRNQMSNEWLTWKSGEEQFEIIREHTHGREIRIGSRAIPVDGCNLKAKKLFNFQGCLWHGHDCWVTRKNKEPLEVNPINKRPMKELYEETQKTTQYLIDQGYEVEQMWECEWKNLKRHDPQIREFISNNFNSWSKRNRGALTEEEILSNISMGNIFGFILCDIEVPENNRNYFSEMPPIFKNTTVSIDDIGDTMKSYAQAHKMMNNPRRMLIGSMWAEQILLTTPLLKWYLDHGLRVTKIHRVIEFEPRACFKDAGERVSNARREGDMDPDKSIIAEMEKLKGNSYYGKTATNKEKHSKVSYMKSSSKLDETVSRSSFRSLSELADDFYEVETCLASIKNDLPIQIAFYVYNYAKLRMLEFYYDFMLKFFNPSDFEYCEMDTDSAYIAFSSKNWINLMKHDRIPEYLAARRKAHNLVTYSPDSLYHWFPRDCCAEHKNYDKRTPGLFKVEWEGDGIVGLCSKTYYCFGEDKDKFSSKGVQKRNNCLNKEKYLDVLYSKVSSGAVNKGFRVVKNNVYTYEQHRNGLSYFYPKRKVNPDGVSTLPLDI